MSLKENQKDFIIKDKTADEIEVVHSKESYIFTADKKKYIDFVMGWCVGNVGWGNEEIRKKIKSFSGPDYVIPQQHYSKWDDLGKLLCDLTPGHLTRCLRATGGTEAVEIAMQVAMTFTKRDKFVSIDGAYHGNSIATQSIGSQEFGPLKRKSFVRCQRIKPPLDEKALNQVERALKKRDVAAFIMEPIICNLNVHIPTPGFMSGVQSLCKKYGTLLVIDEVATGFGRTGKIFATEIFNIEPDIMCLGKAISGGVAALGATIVTERIAKKVEKNFSYYSTFGWHPLSVEAALANIKYLLKHKKQLENNVTSMSAYFTQRLGSMKFKYPAEITVVGLAIGVKFPNPKYAKTVVEKARKNGLFVVEGENGITLFPALNIDMKTAREGLDILEKSL